MTGNEGRGLGCPLAAKVDIMYGYPNHPAERDYALLDSPGAQNNGKKFLQTEDEISAVFTTIRWHSYRA